MEKNKDLLNDIRRYLEQLHVQNRDGLTIPINKDDINYKKNSCSYWK
jgi:hypothetical protein|tara:strand:+ start:858 stop:998 length:141 start_codon:yes stop_codon:yes gene_type:complete